MQLLYLSLYVLIQNSKANELTLNARVDKGAEMQQSSQDRRKQINLNETAFPEVSKTGNKSFIGVTVLFTNIFT